MKTDLYLVMSQEEGQPDKFLEVCPAIQGLNFKGKTDFVIIKMNPFRDAATPLTIEKAETCKAAIEFSNQIHRPTRKITITICPF